MILYGSTLSPFVRKVMAFAQEKGLALDLQPGGMGQGGDAFAEASPLGKMPALRDPGADRGRDFTIADSSAIAHYLEAKHPDPVLIPADPIARARTIWFDEFGDTMVAKLSGACFFNRVVAPTFLGRAGDEAVAEAALRDDLPGIMDYLESVVPEPGGFLVGDRITLADLAVASPFANLSHAGVAVDRDRWPRTMAWVDSVLARPSFAPLVAAETALLERLSART